MNPQNKLNKIALEQCAFDEQILERINHGHVPDLRHALRNEWFYNNVWRDPVYVKMSFIENIHFLKKYLKNHSQVLEIGCGPGHNSLELARYGHHVTGLDLSPKCIEVAKNTLAQNKYRDGFGSVNYHAGDFLKMDLKPVSFDAVMFYGALSHFPDINRVLQRVCELLKPSGRVLIWDTSVDLYNETDACLLYLIRTLLSMCGHYYKTEEPVNTHGDLSAKLTSVLNELKYVDSNGVNVQSANDNSQTLSSMMAALKKDFTQVVFEPDSCFYRNIIAGVRFKNHADEHAVAHLIKIVEKHLVDRKVLSSAFFYYVGERK